MFSEKYGVNTMKAVSKASRTILLILISVGAVFFGSCGKKSGSGDSGQDANVASNANAELSEEKIIEEMLNEVITRLRYGDKSGLYESEFDYFTDETDFDEYLTMGQIRAAQADTINIVEVRDIEFFDRDSAIVEVTVHFEGPTGKKSFFDDKLILYYYKGRWIKPTVTVIDLQMDYEDKIRVADSAAAAEAGEE